MQERYIEFTSLITSLYRLIQKIKSTEMKEIGLKGNQVQCLYYLFYEEEGINAKNLSNLCNEDKAAISRTLKDLERKDYVYLVRKEEKIYKNLYRLTEKGKEKGKYISEKIQLIFEKAGDSLNPIWRNNLYKSLHLIEQNLKNIEKEVN